MIADTRAAARLARLSPLVARELRHLRATDARLFAQPLTPERARQVAEDEDLAERVEAFAARFARLQDTLGARVLPAWLAAHGEPVGAFTENLDRAEKLGLVADAQGWLDMRRLRNQMVHEYVEDPAVLASALQAAHDYIPRLAAAARALLGDAVIPGDVP